MDFRSNNTGGFGIAQRRGGGNGGGLNSAFYNNNMGNYNNGGGSYNNPNNFQERIMGSGNSNFNSHSNFNENINRESLMDRNRSPPMSISRNLNYNPQFNNNGNFGNRNPEGFMPRNRSPSPKPYNSQGMTMMSNDNRERGFSDNYRNMGNFSQQQQMQVDRFGQQNDFNRSNNMNLNQNQGQRRSLMDVDDMFGAKRRYLEDNANLGRSDSNWSNGKNWNNGNSNNSGGNYNNPSQTSSQLNYGNRIYSDNPNPNYNLQNLEDNFGSRGGRNLNMNPQEEIIFRQNGNSGNMLNNEGFRGNMMHRDNERNFGRNNGNMEQSNGNRDRHSTGVWQQASIPNSNIQRSNINSNQNSSNQAASSDSWRASQRDFNANRKAGTNLNSNRMAYNKPPATAPNNRNNQPAVNARATHGGRGGLGQTNQQQKPQATPIGNRSIGIKRQNITPKAVQATQANAPASTRVVAARPGTARPAIRAAALRPAARTGVVRPTARTGGVRPAVRTSVVRPAVRTGAVRPAARSVAARPGVRPVVARNAPASVIRGRVARPFPPVQRIAGRPGTTNKTTTNNNPQTTSNKPAPSTKAEKRQRKLARKRGFILGGLKLAYINNKHLQLPQPEAESYALAFFEEKPIYTINVTNEEDEVSAAIVLDDVLQSEQNNDKADNSEKPSRMMGKRARKQLRLEWSALHDSKDYKSWSNWWTDYKKYGPEIRKELVKLGCLNLEHCFLPYLPNSVNLSTEQVVHGVIKSAQFALGDLPGMPYDALKSIVTLMNVTFLENLKSETDLEILQDTIRGVPNDLWVFKMRSMVNLWTKYKDIEKQINDKEANVATKTNDTEADVVNKDENKEADVKTDDKETSVAKKTNDKEAVATEEIKTSYQYMAKQALKNPCFHWLAMLAFNELVTISEFAWPDHEKVFATI